MKQNITFYLFLCFIIVLMINFLNANQHTRYTYIGSKRCSECHGEDSIGNQYKLWQASPHGKAVRILYTSNAIEIAEKLSIKNPSESDVCLKCHTTGRGKVKALRDEGVGCEACHGPGSEYHEAGNHVDYSDPTRVKGYINGIRHGMYPVLGIMGKHLKNREKMCKRCHIKERPCALVKQKNRYQKKMTIQVVDQLQRGNVIFKHPLRR